MLLDDLYQSIEKLRERMENHQDKLKQSEALTRNALVDPLLRALGWDTEDPAQVLPEYKLGSGFADYALLSGGKPAIVVEAKKLGTPLDGAAAQGITYCINDGIQYFVATDGRKWDVYETHRPVPLAEKKIVSFDIADSPANVCLDALALWRRSVQSGAVRKAQTPLLEQEIRTPLPPIPPEPTPLPEGNWQPLSKFQPRNAKKPPLEIRFPDKSTAPIKNWVGLELAVVDWLTQQDKLDMTGIPIREKDNYIIADSPVHPSGMSFKYPKKVGRIFLETAYGKNGKTRNTKNIIETLGQGVTPEQFSVRLPD